MNSTCPVCNSSSHVEWCGGIGYGFYKCDNCGCNFDSYNQIMRPKEIKKPAKKKTYWWKHLRELFKK